MIRAVLVIAAALAAIAITPGDAAAYPQYQLSHDQTCTGCHLSPAGGNLLNENGLAAKEAMSHLGTAPEFFYMTDTLPDWLHLGGDIRASSGFIATPEKVLASFPMQFELYATAKFDNFSVHLNAGPRPAEVGGSAATRFWSREHFVMWQQKADEGTGFFARVGRFLPVFGLRMIEHPLYTRRFGGTALYTDTYGAHLAYIDPKYEAHVTGFIADPLISGAVSHDSGVAGYAEYRVTETTQVGLEAMYTDGPDDKKLRAGITAKKWLPDAKLLLAAEVQFVNQIIDTTPTNPDGGAPLQIVGNLVGTFNVTDYLQVDVGLGYFDQNIRYRLLERECADLNVRYAMTSHLELQLNARYEMLAFTDGGPSAGYALGQLHYRM